VWHGNQRTLFCIEIFRNSVRFSWFPKFLWVIATRGPPLIDVRTNVRSPTLKEQECGCNSYLFWPLISADDCCLFPVAAASRYAAPVRCLAVRYPRRVAAALWSLLSAAGCCPVPVAGCCLVVRCCWRLADAPLSCSFVWHFPRADAVTRPNHTPHLTPLTSVAYLDA
jgi:hypothetical protein